MKIDVVLHPRQLKPEHLTDRAVAVFDVLRATTTLTTAIASGAKEVRAFDSIDAARQAAAKFDGPKLLCGEQHTLAPPGFDLGNSPGDFTPARVRDRTIFFTTTNGTRAINAVLASSAKPIALFAAALVNASAAALALFACRADVTLLCSGSDGQFSAEDFLGTGAVVAAISRLGPIENAGRDSGGPLGFRKCRKPASDGITPDIWRTQQSSRGPWCRRRFCGPPRCLRRRRQDCRHAAHCRAAMISGLQNTEPRRVVFTGIGVVSPNGVGANAFAEACLAGKSGVSPLRGIEAGRMRSTVAAQVCDFDPTSVLDAVNIRRVPRMIPLALAASIEAMASARLEIDPADVEHQRSIGVALGTGGGGLAFVEEQYRLFHTEGTASLFSITSGTHGNLSSELSIQLHLRGPSHVLSTGCASSTDALAYAAMLIRTGVIPTMLAGGADAPISPGILFAFERMRVISTGRWEPAARASRPFSLDRDGFVLGEGAWMFILEEREHALARGAPIFGELAGYGSTCDAYHRVQIDPEIAEPVRAVEMALAQANCAKDEVGYVNLHGTSTELNDRMETAAMKKCFGPRAEKIPMSSTKSMIGHPQGACGAAGIAATLLCIQRGMLHPTINLEEPDPNCDLDYISEGARKASVDVALCNCIAFGSKKQRSRDSTVIIHELEFRLAVAPQGHLWFS